MSISFAQAQSGPESIISSLKQSSHTIGGSSDHNSQVEAGALDGETEGETIVNSIKITGATDVPLPLPDLPKQGLVVYKLTYFYNINVRGDHRKSLL